ncbi:MAG: RNA 2',3'-cyclic phosphodiesterase [Candidatus Woesearchaeota archaeon]|nr:RNA 2',3'-cyclic phosphodiesterase [Candidatus Woesearchaeota archaeon]
MRLFIAISISKEAEEELKRLQNELRYAKLNLVKDFHLTLKFLGDVDNKKIDKIKERLKEIKSKKFSLELSDIGVFPSENYIRVVWVGLKPENKVVELQNAVESSLEDIFEKDKNFKPHITIARVKAIENKKEFKSIIKNLKVKIVKSEITCFKLIKSTLTPKGPVYEILEKFALY